MSMNQQVANFGNAVLEMRRFFRGNAIALNTYLSRCIFYSGMGSNDYLNNYFMPSFYTSSSDYTTQAYAALLLQDYSRQLTVINLVDPFSIYSVPIASYIIVLHFNLDTKKESSI